jgi:hypothetical protein
MGLIMANGIEASTSKVEFKPNAGLFPPPPPEACRLLIHNTHSFIILSDIVKFNP